MAVERRVSEAAVRRWLGKDAPPCCSSCHDEDDAGYGMCDVTLGRGRYAEVCCAVGSAVRERQEKGDPSLRASADRPTEVWGRYTPYVLHYGEES